MTEKAIVQGAYEDIVKTVSGKFFDAYMIARTPEDKKAAEEHFAAGITAARLACARAMAILPAP